MTLTRSEYLLNIGALAVSIDTARWTLAELAHTAREQGLQDWAEMMGQHPKVRRSPFRVRHWAQVHEFKIATNGNFPEGLTFTHWEVLTTYAARLTPEQLREAAETAAVEGVTVEALRSFLNDTAEKPLTRRVKVKLAFLDWREKGKSVYATDRGVELSMGDFHSGSTFPGTIELDQEQAEELTEAMRSGLQPCFWMAVEK